MVIQLFQNKVVMIGSVVFVSAVAAIVFERAINDLLLSHMNPWSVLGLAIIILGLIPILATMEFLRWHWWTVVGCGTIFVIIGFIRGG